jgi:hypothetical protein
VSAGNRIERRLPVWGRCNQRTDFRSLIIAFILRTHLQTWLRYTILVYFCLERLETKNMFISDCPTKKQSHNLPMEAQGERGCIAPTHSRPRPCMGVSGQRHVPAALYPPLKYRVTHCTGDWVGPRAGLDTEVRGNISCLCPRSNLDRQVVQSVARHYTDWDTTVLLHYLTIHFSLLCGRLYFVDTHSGPWRLF